MHGELWPWEPLPVASVYSVKEEAVGGLSSGPWVGDIGERAGRGEGLPEVTSLGKRRINVRLFDP